jgi:hypothetical protein
MRTMPDLDIITRELDAVGVHWRVEWGTKHPALVMRVDGIERRVILPGSPSDPRSLMNVRSRVRRIAREMGIDPARV